MVVDEKWGWQVPAKSTTPVVPTQASSLVDSMSNAQYNDLLLGQIKGMSCWQLPCKYIMYSTPDYKAIAAQNPDIIWGAMV